MKKRSFFERLAGNLRFDDTDDETTPASVIPPAIERREVSVSKETEMNELQATVEEVGELPVDVYETSGEIIIQTLIAGVMPENLSINITRDVVTISGKREENKGIAPEAYHIRELYWGSFGRTVNLPEEIEIDAAEAIERHGMLIIKLPKIDKKRKTVLKIKSI